MQVVKVRAVAHETAGLHILLGPEHSRQSVLQRKLGQGHALGDGKWRRHDEKTTGTRPHHRPERLVKLFDGSCGHMRSWTPSFSPAACTACTAGPWEGVVGFQRTPIRVACGMASL